MDSAEPLQQEINDTLQSLHDFAKWKLIIVAGLAATAVGLAGDSGAAIHWLLIFVPFACAYVDLNGYQYLLRIFVISRFLQDRGKGTLLGDYEEFSNTARKDGVFSLGWFAGVGASVAFSLLLPAYGFYHLLMDGISFRLVQASAITWLVGVASVVVCFVVFKRNEAKVVQLSLVTTAQDNDFDFARREKAILSQPSVTEQTDAVEP